MNLETKITIYKFTPQLFTLTPHNSFWRGVWNKIYKYRQVKLLSVRTSSYSVFQRRSWVFKSSNYSSQAVFYTWWYQRNY